MLLDFDNWTSKEYLILLFFITGDITCGNFSGLLSRNVLSEHSSSHTFGGLLVYLNRTEEVLWKQMLQNIEEFPEIIDLIDQYGIDDPSLMEELNNFGKYKYKKSKSKKPKPKSTNTSKKLEKLKKEALKMGLSKSSLKQGMAKLQKSITKLKSLAKKYRLKINKKLITNIKKCIKIHDKAIKLKIKLTKTTKSGKRLYKTPSELLREIKSKMKQSKKTKYSRKTKQNKHSKKR